MSQTENGLRLIKLRADLNLNSSPDNIKSLLRSGEHGLFDIFKNHLERPVGYLTWANINKESFRRLLDFNENLRYAYEWNEGRIVLITDVAFSRNNRQGLRKRLEEALKGRRVVAFRRNGVLSVYTRTNGRFRLALKKTAVSADRQASQVAWRQAIQGG